MAKIYTIGELAEAADVTTRTIRYYVSEGLLPPPDKQGRVATYSDEYIARLELIIILKEEFLPLQEIRSLLTGLDHQAVLDLLAEKQKSKPILPTPDAAKVYLKTLLTQQSIPDGQQSMLRHRIQARQAGIEAHSADIAQEGEAATTPAPELAELGFGQAQTSTPSEAAITRWQRIQITSEIELHVKEGVEKTSLWKKIEQVIKIARQLLSAVLI